MLSKDRYKTTSGFFVIPLLSQLWEEKNYCERINELSSWRPVALPNRHIHLCLFKIGYDVHALLYSVMYILSGENITAVYTISRLHRYQNSWQVANRLDRAGATYVRLLHVPPWLIYLWEIYIYFQERSVYFAAAKYVDRSWEYINLSQTHECGNLGLRPRNPRKGIHTWDFSLQCRVGFPGSNLGLSPWGDS